MTQSEADVEGAVQRERAGAPGPGPGRRGGRAVAGEV